MGFLNRLQGSIKGVGEKAGSAAKAALIKTKEEAMQRFYEERARGQAERDKKRREYKNPLLGELDSNAMLFGRQSKTTGRTGEFGMDYSMLLGTPTVAPHRVHRRTHRKKRRIVVYV